MTPLTEPNGDRVRLALKVGQGVKLPDGKGSIQLDGWTRWVKLQVSDTPGVTISLVALAFAVAGLCLSLFVRPRRIWVRVRPADDGHNLVEVGGLDRADARVGLSDDVAELAAELGERREKVGAA
jgi:cytochrome c biogenesis protein